MSRRFRQTCAGHRLCTGKRHRQPLHTARYRLDTEGRVIPSITGRAFVTLEAKLIRDANDPFADGIVG